MTDLVSDVVDLAQRTGGLVSQQDLDALGASRHQRQRLVTSELLRPVAPRLYAIGRSSLSWEQRLKVAVLQAGPSALVSHASAARLWQFPRIGPGAVEITVDRNAPRPRLASGRLHTSRDPGPAGRVGDLPVTSPGRTLFDLSTRIGPVVFDECLQDLGRRRLLTVDELWAMVEQRRRSGLDGICRMEELLEGVTMLPVNDSWLEEKFLRLVRDAGLPLPETQVPFEVDGHHYRVDCLWRAVRLIVELLGYATHATRTETTADAERTTRLQSLGYEVMPVTYDQVVGDPEFVVAQVRRRVFLMSPPGRVA